MKKLITSNAQTTGVSRWKANSKPTFSRIGKRSLEGTEIPPALAGWFFTFLITVFQLMTFSVIAAPVMSSQKEAAYFATLKAVLDYKMQDEKIKDDLEKLRQNKKFNAWLEKSLSELSNAKNKNGKNQNIYNILHDSGAQIYNQLN